MRNSRKLKAILSMVLAIAMVLTSTVVLSPKKAEAKTVLMDKTISLKYNKHADSRYNWDAQKTILGLIANPKKNATYSVKIKNKKVAKVATNKFEEKNQKKAVTWETSWTDTERLSC